VPNVAFEIVECIGDGYVHPSLSKKDIFYAPCRIYVTALCDISAGSALLVDYGHQYNNRHL
jgi:hypothetical protein